MLIFRLFIFLVFMPIFIGGLSSCSYFTATGLNTKQSNKYVKQKIDFKLGIENFNSKITPITYYYYLDDFSKNQKLDAQYRNRLQNIYIKNRIKAQKIKLLTKNSFFVNHCKENLFSKKEDTKGGLFSINGRLYISFKSLINEFLNRLGYKAKYLTGTESIVSKKFYLDIQMNTNYNFFFNLINRELSKRGACLFRTNNLNNSNSTFYVKTIF